MRTSPATELLLLAALAAVLAWLLTGLVLQKLAAHGILDVPNHRSSHDRVVPRGGGIAIATVTTALAGAGWWWTSSFVFTTVLALLCAVLLGVVGFVDDRREVAVGTRLTIQVILGVALVAAVAAQTTLGWQVGLIAVPLVLIYLVGATNIYNFMDGIDGIAAATAIGVGLSAIVFANLAGTVDIAVLGAVVVGACVGFLRFNWSPARIFMGDTGSLYLGFLAASLPLVAGRHEFYGVLTVGALLPFLVDGGFTILRRWSRGEPVTQPHRSHVYQRAANRWGHAPITVVYGLGALVAGVVPVAAGSVSYARGVVALASLSLAAVVAWLMTDRWLRNSD